MNIELEINKDEFKKKLDIKDGEPGKKGDSVKGDPGEKGDIGKSIKGDPGQNGSPDTPDEVVEKVNSAKKKIEPERIKGLSTALRLIDDYGKNPMGNVVGGAGANQYVIKSDGVRVSDHVTELDFTTNLDVVYSGNGKVSISASASSTYVPYTGATANLDMGSFAITNNTGYAIYSGGNALFAGGGFVIDTSGNLNSTSANAYFNSFVKTGGTSSEFLKADGTVDSTVYSTNPMTTIGDIIYGDIAGVPTRLADVATGNALVSGGIGVAPAWGKIALTTHVSGTLPVANGGTGATTFTNDRVLTGNGTSAIVDEANLTFNSTAGLSITAADGNGLLLSTPGYAVFTFNGPSSGIFRNNTSAFFIDQQSSDPIYLRTNGGGTYALVLTSAGKAGFHDVTGPTAFIETEGTTEQLRLRYNSTNYLSTTVASTGSTTFALTGTAPIFNFSNTIKPRTGGTAAGSEPFQFTSASLLTTATVGTFEFLTDKYYATITTGAARKELTLNDESLTSGRIPFATTNGRLTDDSDLTFSVDTLTATKIVAPTSIQVGGGAVVTVLDYGTYTPTLINTTNVAASTARLCTYMRIGGTVTVSGQLDIDPTTTLTATLLGISLPIASALTTAFQLGGTASATAISGMTAGIEADATNDRASLKFIATDVSNQTMCFTFTYQII